MSPSIDTTLCPLCGKSNSCAMELASATGQAQPPCWCTEATFSAELLASIPDSLRNKSCICPACASTSGPVKPGTGTA
jgi:hypothetical protein